MDTGVFNDDRYFDVFVEYAKADVEDILIRISAANRGPEAAALHVLPTIWFRNRWSWGKNKDPKPSLRKGNSGPMATIEVDHFQYVPRWLYCDGGPELLFTENETNTERLYGIPNASPYTKDGINDYVVNGASGTVNPEQVGTKAAANYSLTINPGETATIRLRLTTKTVTDRLPNLRRLRKNLFGEDSRGGRVLQNSNTRRSFSRRPSSDAAILRRPSLVQAVLSLRSKRVA